MSNYVKMFDLCWNPVVDLINSLVMVIGSSAETQGEISDGPGSHL